ncbi:MAG TPA: hypothetical protein VN667_08970 [Burkholderiales bacterium]|nr:hypothetical protein [Burkholderiales bacterium]
MAKTAVTQWDTTAANNTDVGAIAIQGTSPISNFDNAMREIMAQIATFITDATFTGTTTLGVTNITSSSTTPLTVTSTDAGAGNGPFLTLDRNSASPAANDLLATILFQGRDSGAATQNYATIDAQVIDPTAASEDGRLRFTTAIAGANQVRAYIGNGLYTLNATSGDMGADTINASAYYDDGVLIPTTAATAAQYRANTAGLMLTTDKVWSAAAEVTLTDAATIAVDFSTFINAVVTLGGNRALGNPTNEKVGQTGRIRIVQDGTGSRTLSYGTDWEFAGGVAPVLSTAAGAQDLLYYDIIATDRIFASLNKAIA